MNILHSRIIPQICKEENYVYEKINDYSCLVNGKLVYEFNFECDSSSSCLFAKDKSVTHEFLKKNKIDSVEHKYIPYQDALKYKFEKDIVLKDIAGTCGIDVYLIKSQEEYENAVKFLMYKGKRICISPFENIENEYRVVMVNYQPKFIYAKKRKENQWKHNLILGAEIELVHSEKLRKSLVYIAKKVSKLFKLKTCSIDIVDVDSKLKVLEVNSGLMMEKLSEKYYNEVKNIYKEVLNI